MQLRKGTALIDEAMLNLLTSIQKDLESAVSAEEENDLLGARSAIDQARQRIRTVLEPLKITEEHSGSED